MNSRMIQILVSFIFLHLGICTDIFANVIIEKITNYYLNEKHEEINPDIFFCQDFFIDKKVLKTSRYEIVLVINTGGLYQKEIAQKYLKKLSSVFKKILQSAEKHYPSLQKTFENEHNHFFVQHLPTFFRAIIHNVSFIIIPKTKNFFVWGGFGHQSLYQRMQKKLSKMNKITANSPFFEQKIPRIPQSITIGFELPHKLHEIKEPPTPMIELLFKKKKRKRSAQKQVDVESFHLEYTSSVSSSALPYFDTTVSGSLSPLVDPVTFLIKIPVLKTPEMPLQTSIEKESLRAQIHERAQKYRLRAQKKQHHIKKNKASIVKKIKKSSYKRTKKSGLQTKKSPKINRMLLKKIKKLEQQKKLLQEKIKKKNKEKQAKKIVFSLVESFYMKKSAKLPRSKKAHLKKKIRKKQERVWKSVRYALQNFKTKNDLRFFIKKYAKKLEFGALVLKSLEKINASNRNRKHFIRKIQADVKKRIKAHKKKQKKKKSEKIKNQLRQKRGFATDRYFRDFKGDVDFYKHRLRRLNRKIL